MLYVPLEPLCLPTSLHAFTPQKTNTYIFTAVRMFYVVRIIPCIDRFILNRPKQIQRNI